MSSGPVCAMVWEGLDVVKTGRCKFPSSNITPRPLTFVLPGMLGATDPLASAPGTIRGDFAIHLGRNVCHGSDSVDSAQKEIKQWFKGEVLINYHSSGKEWVYDFSDKRIEVQTKEPATSEGLPVDKL